MRSIACPKRLRLGDDWDVALAEAQRASRVSVILVSDRTPRAYYQREEVAAAIALTRRDGASHRVVPVYLDGWPDEHSGVPYGLRLKHGCSLPDLGREEIARQLLELVEARVDGRASTAREGGPPPPAPPRDRPRPTPSHSSAVEGDDNVVIQVGGNAGNIDASRRRG